MDKLSNLLDETTIVNFKMLWKIIGRYRSHLSVSIVCFCILFFYFYFSQPIIHSISIPIKTVASHTVSTDLSALLPVENTSGITLNEISVSLSSYAFSKSFAEAMVSVDNFDRLDFGAITNGKNLLGKSIRSSCKNNSTCMAEQLFGVLSGSYSIEQGLTDNRYSITISALDEFTVTTMAKTLVVTIEKSRIKARQYLVRKEMDSVSNLIKESNLIIKNVNGFKILEDDERNQGTILDLKERIRTLQSTINIESSRLTSLGSRVSENNKNLFESRKIDKLGQLHVVSTQLKADELRQNIAILSNIPADKRSDSDNLILNELNKQLDELDSKLPKDGRYIASTFKDTNNSELVQSKNTEFEYEVAKGNLGRLEIEYNLAKEKLNEYGIGKISKDSTASKLKADLDFLKNLESKLLSLKLLNSTMTSDLLFEEFGRGSREFRRSSLAKIFLFCFFIIFFFYLISILVRYLLDDRIYSEDDLKIYFNNLDFIGEVPAFD